MAAAAAKFKGSMAQGFSLPSNYQKLELLPINGQIITTPS